MPLPKGRRNLLTELATQCWYRLAGIPNPALPIGARGEFIAAQFLRRKGLRILEQNLSNQLGEIDLIALDRGPPRRIVFVEVKTRIDQLEDHSGDHPADRVDEDKQRRLTRAALAYLKRHRLLEVPCRFDVVAIWWPREGLLPYRINHFENAFEATGCPSLFS